MDFVFDSKGRVTESGYEIEARIPLTSIRFQGTDPQDWALQVIRFVQHSGYQQTWTPARRGASSLLTQSGTLAGIAGLQRDQVVEITPEFTSARSGQQLATGWATKPTTRSAGTCAGAWRPTLRSTPRSSRTSRRSKPMRRRSPAMRASRCSFRRSGPFFVDGLEQFDTPDLLIYTRRILQPNAALKLSGKLGRTSLACSRRSTRRAASVSETTIRSSTWCASVATCQPRRPPA